MTQCLGADELALVLVSEEIGPEIRTHLKECTSCQRTVSESAALMGLAGAFEALRQGNTEPLPDGMADRIFAKIEPLFQQIVDADPKQILDEALRLAVRFSPPGGHDHGLFALDEELTVPLRKSLGHLAVPHDPSIVRLIRDHDPLCVLAAGAADTEAVRSSPLWFTNLMRPPESLSWVAPAGGGPWQVRLWSVKSGELLRQKVEGTSVVIPAAVQIRIPRRADVRWEVRRADDPPEARPLVRGVFQVLAEANVAEVETCLHTSEQVTAPLDRDFLKARCLFDAGLWEPLLAHLGQLKEHYTVGTHGFLVHRAEAGVFVAVSRELTGSRLLGDPEGSWAREQSEVCLNAAYKILKIEYKS